MINVSNAFKQQLYEGHRNYLEYVDIALSNGGVLNLTNADLWQGGLTIEDAVSSDSTFDVGAAIINKCTVVINNIYETFSTYDFTDAQVVAYVGLELPDGRKERIRKGTYAVDEARYNGSIITLSCLDNMRKFDKAYSASVLKYPATLEQIVLDACSTCNVVLQTYKFPHSDFVISTRPNGESTTFREVISWVAQIACCFCRCDVYGALEIKWYDQEALEVANLDGGLFDTASTSTYTSGDNADGGTFSPWNTGYEYDGGTFEELRGVHHIASKYSMDISVDDVVITGIKVLEKTEEDGKEAIVTYQSGSEGYVISIENNDLITDGIGQAVVGWLGQQLIGFRFRRGSVTHVSDPTIEAGDVGFLTDRKGNTYRIVISSTKFSTGASQATISSAENPARNSADRYSAETKNYVGYRKAIEKERTDREVAVNHLSSVLSSSPGLYVTEDPPGDPNAVRYLHDKPTIAESKNVIRITSEAIGISNDGGKTYPYGLEFSGTVILEKIYAVGIDADYITSGAISIQNEKGKETFYADTKTGIVRISADSFSLSSGKTIETIVQEEVGVVNEELNNFIDNVYNSEIAGIQSRLDGQIETWYYDYEPTLNNLPASGWTNELERKKHVGDLFFWKSKGYSYRFFKDENTWKWQLITDSDITKALKEASDAQDTADSKRRVFVQTPTPPYDIGDLWAQGEDGDIMRCQVARASGSYVSSDWIKASKYTDNSALNAFISGEFAESIEDLQLQADKKAETWYQITDPSTAWATTAVKNEHIGDIWFNSTPSIQKSYRWNGASWVEMKSEPPDSVLDKVDGKAQIFVSQPNPPYDIGDLWAQGSAGDIKVCKTAKASNQSYSASDWVLASKYISSGQAAEAATSAAEETWSEKTNVDIFNKLTKNGAAQGIIMDAEGNLYINASYISSGALSADYIKGGALVLGGKGNTFGTAKILNFKEEEAIWIDSNGITVGMDEDERVRLDGGIITFSNKSSTSPVLGDITGGILSGLGYMTMWSNNGITISITADQKAFASTTMMSDGARGIYTDYPYIFKQRVQVFGNIFISGEEYGNTRLIPVIYYVQYEGATAKALVELSSSGITIRGGLYVNGTMAADKKANIARTQNYDDRLFYCYEMPSPMYGDIGSGKTDEEGTCIVFINDIFQEAISSMEYHVFLQKEGQGDLWVESKDSAFFVVKGTPELKFSWEIKAAQKGDELTKLELFDNSGEESGIDYMDGYMQERERLIEEKGGIIDETT